jgi:hypothetical protein
MLPKNGSVVGKDPSFSFIDLPVRVGDPGSAFVWVSAFSPTLKLLKQQVSAVLEGGIGYHTPIVIGPSMDHLVQFFNELSLGNVGMLFDELFQFLDMPLHCLLTWGDNGFEAKRIAPSICPGVGLSDRKLSDGPAKKIKPYPPVMWVERVGNLGFACF